MHKKLSLSNILFICFFSLTTLVFTKLVFADELYVIKNVKVHTEALLESPVTQLLLGGEKVNVLAIDGDFTKIEDKDENTGWVASDFLTNVEPIKIATLEQDANKAKPQNKIEKKILKKPPTKNNVVKKLTTNEINKDIDKRINEKLDINLQIENTQLKKQLLQIQEILNNDNTSENHNIIDTADQNKQHPLTTPSTLNFTLSHIPLWVTIVALIIGFILGLLWSDFRQRRQHGGFKV